MIKVYKLVYEGEINGLYPIVTSELSTDEDNLEKLMIYGDTEKEQEDIQSIMTEFSGGQVQVSTMQILEDNNDS